MHSLAVVPHRDVIQDILLSGISRSIISPMNALLLQAAVEAFCYGIIPTTSFFVHATDKLMQLKYSPILKARIMNALI